MAHSVLSENGLLLIIDVIREPNETLSTYLDNYCQWLREEWLEFDEQDLTAIIQHIRHNDMPETVSGLSALAEAADFHPATGLHYLTWRQAISFSKKNRAI